MKFHTQVVAWALGTASLFALSGCGGLPSGQEVPANTGRPSFMVQRYEPSKMDLPPTAYQIPGSAFVIFDQRKTAGMGLTAALLGPIGVLIRSEAGRTATSGVVADQSIDLINLEEFTERTLRQQIRELSGSRMATSIKDQEQTFALTTSGWLNLVNDSEAKLSLALNVQLVDSAGNVSWQNKYLYHSPESRPIVGNGGWLDNKSARVGEVTTLGLAKAIRVALNDIGRYRYTDTREVKLRGCLSGARSLVLLAKDENSLVIKAQYNKGTGSMTHIVDSTECPLVE
jgi:hypothetical protein